jgi:arylsulfatase A-like enzyme
MDRAIGKLRSHLARQGIKDNTLLFYCGDNGTSADASLGGPHRGVKSTLYEGGILVPGLVEWPARIPKPVTSSFRASTSDLLPTLCSIAGIVPPNRPLDGVDLTPAIDGTATSRTQPLAFWEYPTGRANRDRSTPWIEPRLQEGTTPLVKLMNGKPTRDFLNLRIDNVTPDDRLGPRAIVIGDWKYVVHGQKADGLKRELFDLRTDPAEKANLAAQHPDRVAEMEAELSSWQDSVVASLLGKDYATK